MKTNHNIRPTQRGPAIASSIWHVASSYLLRITLVTCLFAVATTLLASPPGDDGSQTLVVFDADDWTIQDGRGFHRARTITGDQLHVLASRASNETDSKDRFEKIDGAVGLHYEISNAPASWIAFHFAIQGRGDQIPWTPDLRDYQAVRVRYLDQGHPTDSGPPAFGLELAQQSQKIAGVGGPLRSMDDGPNAWVIPVSALADQLDKRGPIEFDTIQLVISIGSYSSPPKGTLYIKRVELVGETEKVGKPVTEGQPGNQVEDDQNQGGYDQNPWAPFNVVAILVVAVVAVPVVAAMVVLAAQIILQSSDSSNSASRATTLASPYGRYELIKETPVRRGGMSELFLVKQGGTKYLLKTIRTDKYPPGNARSEQLCERFRQEADMLRVLNGAGSSHIVRFVDRGERELGIHRIPYIIIELVRGCDLAELVELAQKKDARRKGLPKRLAFRLMRETAEALEAIHSLGYIHRDVKPNNLLVSVETRQIKVIDFGIAADLDDPADLGLVAGTTDYIAPEEVKGPPADIYGLGRTLRFALSGSPLGPVDEAVDRLATRMTKEDPTERPTIGVVLNQLKRFEASADPSESDIDVIPQSFITGE